MNEQNAETAIINSIPFERPTHADRRLGDLLINEQFRAAVEQTYSATILKMQVPVIPAQSFYDAVFAEYNQEAQERDEQIQELRQNAPLNIATPVVLPLRYLYRNMQADRPIPVETSKVAQLYNATDVFVPTHAPEYIDSTGMLVEQSPVIFRTRRVLYALCQYGIPEQELDSQTYLKPVSVPLLIVHPTSVISPEMDGYIRSMNMQAFRYAKEAFLYEFYHWIDQTVRGFEKQKKRMKLVWDSPLISEKIIHSHDLQKGLLQKGIREYMTVLDGLVAQEKVDYAGHSPASLQAYLGGFVGM